MYNLIVYKFTYIFAPIYKLKLNIMDKFVTVFDCRVIFTDASFFDVSVDSPGIEYILSQENVDHIVITGFNHLSE